VNISLTLYVDDLFMINKLLCAINEVKDILSREFEIKISMKWNSFLGVEIKND
jgi:hypothetical protein